MAQRKETKKKVVRDLKPKKDAKGGRVPPGGHAGDRPVPGGGKAMTRVFGP